MNQPTINWTAALAEHDRWLRTVVLARLGEPQAVDEVMQEVALAAVRQALLFRRKCGRRRKLADRYEKVQPDGVPPAPDPLGWLLAEERRSQVRRAVSSLPPRDAEILLLKYTENWNYRQIAARLGLSTSAVEARLHRARRRLRQELAALNVIEVDS